MSIFDEISGVQGSKPVCRCAKSPIWCAGAHGSREAGVRASDRTDLGVPNSTVFLCIVKLRTNLVFYDTIIYQRLCHIHDQCLIYCKCHLETLLASVPNFQSLLDGSRMCSPAKVEAPVF